MNTPLRATIQTALLAQAALGRELARLQPKLKAMLSIDPASEFQDDVVFELGTLCVELTMMRARAALTEDLIDRSRAFGKSPPSPVFDGKSQCVS